MQDSRTFDPSLDGTASGGVPVAPPVVRGWQGWLWLPVKLLIGTILMQSPGGAVVVTGWLQRFLRRAVYRGWWKRSRGRLGTFDEFVAEEPMLLGFRRLPNWVMAQERGVAVATEPGTGEARERGAGASAGSMDDGAGKKGDTSPSPEDREWQGAPLRRSRSFADRYLGSLGMNLWMGILTLANVAVLTMPGAVLWWVGWWGGWQNSFHKGYEQSMVGPLVSWMGILLFIAAMFYVPMAVARQAATGQWRSFWEGRTVWSLVRASWWQSAWVAASYAAANGLVMILKSGPQFLPQVWMADLAKRGLDPTEAFQRGIEKVDWSHLTDGQALELLNVYYLGSALVVLGVLLGLKRLLAWMYSGAVLRALQRGTLGEEQLSDTEWRLLNTLGLLQVRESTTRPMLVRIVAWAGTKVGRAVCGTWVFVAWFAFVAAVYATEFLSYHPVVGWLNQPLVQLPWFRYVPSTLENPAPALLVMGVLVLGACVYQRLRGRVSSRRRPTAGC